jgi:hypothetical protein
MHTLIAKLSVFLFLVGSASISLAADVVPTDIMQPGTQPGEVGNLEDPDKCDNCHGGYNPAVEPAFNWRGSMMGNAGRDPIFWATLAIAEQDFDGAGDLCVRCHSTGGWYGGRSIPTDGSGLLASDDEGVDCDTCHKMTNPDNTELLGEMFAPFIANDGQDPAEGYYGSGILSLWGGSEKLGPYSDAAARHQFQQSKFHRSVDFCGSCHDVSNPVVGDLAHNNGTQASADPVTFDGTPGSPVDGKAAFNNPPYKYGVVERTFSEYKSGLASVTRVADYATLPLELQDGAYKAAYQSALTAGTEGNYADGDTRYFSCQTCHLRPVTGPGCNKKGAPIRSDLPLHDMTGGNYWIADAIQWQDQQGKLLLGGGLTALQNAALDDGQIRAMKQLAEAASLNVGVDKVRINNLTGHKLITGYPEGRRMWLNIKWYDNNGAMLREDGEYGPIGVTVTDSAGVSHEVESLLDLYDPNTKIYEAHYGMTSEWAAQLVALGKDTSMPLGFDRYSGNVDYTLGNLASASGTVHETFHFVLNNAVVKDNRIPPYGMSYDEARKRNALPVPATQFGNPGTGGTYDYFDEVTLNPPADAVWAEIDLLYQSTSWEYIQFLYLANRGENAFLGQEGINMLDAWLNTGMAKPYVMVSAAWGEAPAPEVPLMAADSILTYRAPKKGNLVLTDTFKTQETIAIVVGVSDQVQVALSGVQVFMEVSNAAGDPITNLQEFTDEGGLAELRWRIPRNQAPGAYTATVTDMLKSGYQYEGPPGSDSVPFTIQ